MYLVRKLQMFVHTNINYILFCTIIKTKKVYKRSNCKQGTAIFHADLSYNCNSAETACMFLNWMVENLPQASKLLEALVDSFLSASNSLHKFCFFRRNFDASNCLRAKHICWGFPNISIIGLNPLAIFEHVLQSCSKILMSLK